MPTAPKFIDLFAGCGGLSLGLSRAGWRGVFAVEKDPMAFATLKANLVNGPSTFRFRWPRPLPKEALDVRVLLKDYPFVLRAQRDCVDLIAGGPPCQGFSAAGKRDGADPRNQMLLHYVQIVQHVRPKFILVENVQGIATKHRGEAEAYADILLRRLGDAEYLCISSVVKASDCGVPQERPRFILIGIDRRAFPHVSTEEVLRELWEQAIEAGRFQLFDSLGLTRRMTTCWDAISDLHTQAKVLDECPDAPGRKQIRYSGPITRYQEVMHDGTAQMDSMRLAKHSADTVARFTWIQKQFKKGRVNVGKEDLGVFANKKHTQVLLDANRLSRTLTTLPDDLIHYSEPRILTVREYARLQSFPDWFRFHGKYTTGGELRKKECPRYTQIGNAVAPFVAQALGFAISELRKLLNAHARQVVRDANAGSKQPVDQASRKSGPGVRVRVWGSARG